jgi:hypothetical protein
MTILDQFETLRFAVYVNSADASRLHALVQDNAAASADLADAIKKLDAAAHCVEAALAAVASS